MVTICIFVIILNIVIGKIKTKTIFNPISLASISLSITLISVLACEALDLLRFATSKDVNQIYFVILIGELGFLIPWLFLGTGSNHTIDNSLIIEQKEIDIIDKRIAIFGGLAFIGIIIVSIYVGGLPLLKMAAGKENVNEHNELLKDLPFGLMAIILNGEILFFLFLVERLFENKNSIKFSTKVSLIFLSLLFCFWQGKRQLMLLAAFFYISYFFLFKFKKLKLKNIIFIVFISFTFYYLFNLTSEVRNNFQIDDSVKSFELLEYSMYPPMNLASIINYYPNTGSAFFPKAILMEILPSRYVPEVSKEYRDILFEQTSPSGYFSYWYIDYGYIGVFFGSLILSIFSLYYYIKQRKNTSYRKIYLLLLWCCVTVGVYNHFISLNFFIVPFIFLNVLKLKK